jgi:glycosyltransferase involved in cell wall biosynthesis
MQDICLVVPCYNEEKRLPSDRLLAFLATRERVHLCLVNDGSSDGTAGVLEGVRALNPARVTVLNLTVNSGKAEAVRQGILHACAMRRFALIGYWDADLSTPLGQLDAILEAFDEFPACRFAMGSRVKRLGSNIDRLVIRHVLGRLFATCASAILQLPVYDSQCGSKVFRAELVDLLFGDRFKTRWSFDVELLARLRNALGREGALRAAVEVPLTVWIDVAGSKLGLVDMVRVPLELLKIHTSYNLRSARENRP